MNEFDEGRTREEYEVACERFPYPVEIVHGAQALEIYERLKTESAWTPIILGCVYDFTLIVETMMRNRAEHPSIDLILDRAQDINFPAALYRTRRCRPRRMDAEAYEWPDAPGENLGLAIVRNYTGEPYRRVHIALLPTRDWTETPAYLRAGGWNDCPDAALQVAALRSWRDRYDIELVGCSFDTMNIRVGMGPTSRPEAIVLAEEHRLFCPEIAEEELPELAANLIAYDWWYFWWD